jgi:protein-S-isoprenylcysteine O-methyltransferase Ste14
LANVAGTLLYLGLAVLGWGNISDFFSHPAFIALTVVLCGLVIASLFTGGNLSSGVREDRANRWVLLAIGLLGLLSPYIAARTDRMGFWTIDGDGVRWLGVFLFAAGGILRILPVFVLGNRFSGLLTLLLVVPIVARIRSEERLLQEQFGSEYDAYRARTSRLIPGVY